jgi:polysaccharide export outer membrane protein
MNQTRSARQLVIPLTVAFQLAFLAGCSTLSSLGLPVAAGPHQLMSSSEAMRNAVTVAAPLPRELAKDVLPAYRVEPGDVLVVEPDDFNTAIKLPGDQPVQPDGTIELGQFGRLPVVGKTVPEIEVEVRSLIEGQLAAEDAETTVDSEPDGAQNSKHSVSVRLMSRESKVVYVVGEVNLPGAYPLAGRETILDALMLAGGLTDRANEHKLIFSRPTRPGECRIVLPVCYRQIVQLGDTSTNYQVMPGDRIYVPSLTFHDDLRQSLALGREKPCPRCAAPQTACYAFSRGRRRNGLHHCQRR